MGSRSAKKKKRNQRQQPDKFAALRRKLAEGPFEVEIQPTPKGQKKMSAVLEDFVEPYLQMIDDTETSYRNLLSLAVLAWNLALLPKEQQQEKIETFKQAIPGDVWADLEDVLAMLIIRRQAHFADNKRTIASYDLKRTATGYFLSVAATLEHPPAGNKAR